MKYDTDLDLKTNLKKLLGCYSTHHIFGATRNLRTERDNLRTERDNLRTERDNLRESYNSSGKKRRALRDKFKTLETQHNELLGTINGLKQLVELPESAGLTELFETLDTVKYERDLYRDDANTQIGEITKMLVEAGLMRRNVNSSIDELIKDRLAAQGTINGLKHLVELPESAGLTELFNAVEALELKKSVLDDVTSLLSNKGVMDTNVLTSVHKLLAAQPMQGTISNVKAYDRPLTPEEVANLAAQSQLNEIKYIVHGDIQPCTVLYSDGTTTLLRLDENDMMLETETIEWSDVTTYRCQELLRASQCKQHVSVATVKAVAQLVRDERILLVDESPVDSDEVFTTQPMVARAPMQRPQER